MELIAPRIALRAMLWMKVGEENLGGHGRMTLLLRIAECGSIARAAKAMKMSYKAAWDAVDAMNNLAGEPLVERFTGGKGGGGAKLTGRGERLVNNFRIVEREHQRFVEALGRQANGLADDYLLLGRMDMKSSARNQFHGTVSAIRSGVVNDEIELRIVGGQEIVAVITRDSTQRLGLAVGGEVFALVKSSSVIVASDIQGSRFSARNCLTGAISRLAPGAVNTEVVIDLPEGGSVAAIITKESAQNLDLAVGKTVSAIFKASSVILGVSA
ncbi:MAG: TOBE domain-containing protein [Betaproteobacteria bacterium]|nr:TOBE domain-containing protein [Betaproteobacteria bacterium]MCL2886142.1 TOBE domain-containing protein [Betaproteobacteria bacterium]